MQTFGIDFRQTTIAAIPSAMIKNDRLVEQTNKTKTNNNKMGGGGGGVRREGASFT